MSRIITAGLIAVAFVATAFRSNDAPRLAVVDVSKLVGQSKQSHGEQELLDQWRKTNQMMIEEREKGYNAKLAGLDQFKEGSDEYKKLARELKLAKYELESDVDGLKNEFERRLAKSISESHGRVTVACKSFLESHDLDAILQYNPTPVSGSTRGDVIPDIVAREVIAWKKTIDVTDDVLALLDSGK